MATDRLAYKCDLSISYILNSTSYPIASSQVKYILIESKYESEYMPVLYISLSLSNEDYARVIKNEKTGKFYVRLRKYNAYSKTAIYKNYINGQFSYIPSTSNPNYQEDLAPGGNVDSAYRTIMVALISMDLLNNAKTSFNGIFGNMDQYTMISKAMEGLDAVILAPKYNATFETIIIPAMGSKTKLLNFIFQENPFYDTQYIFFMDFDKAYLLDLSGEGCPSNDGQLNDIIIDINGVTDPTSYYEGITERDGAYQIYVNPANTNISPNKAIDKIANQMVFVDDDCQVTYVDLDVNSNADSTTKQAFMRGSNAVLYKNIVESNTILLEFTKENLDGSIFTPNKRYMVNNFPGYEEYNGTYTLLYKKETIKNTNGEFGIAVSIGLKKVGNIQALGLAGTLSANRRSTSSSAKYTTTASSVGSRANGITSSTRTPTTTASYNTRAGLVGQKKVVKLPTVRRIKADKNTQSLKRKIKKAGEG